MSDLLSTLISLLQNQLEHHSHLLEVLQTERGLIGKASASEFLRVQSEKQQIARRVKMLEEQRLHCVEQLAGLWQMEASELTLKSVIAHCRTAPGLSDHAHEQADQLASLHQQLLEKIAMIKEAAEHNGRLSEIRLKPIEWSLKVLDQARQQSTYSGKGQINQASRTLTRISA